MNTKYIKIEQNDPRNASTEIQQAGRILREGGLVAFPTETVYGLGANGLDAAAVGKIFQAKGRPADNPLILHIADREALASLVREVPTWLVPLLDRFWPGPLTVVLPRADCVPDIVTAGLDSVAVRLPSSPVARELIRSAGVPVAAPSANLSGRPSPTTATAVMADMAGRIEMVLDGGACEIGLESTVLDCTAAIPTILRPGGVTQEMLAECLLQVTVAGGNNETGSDTPRAPGMKYRHYAPSAPLILLPYEPAGNAGELIRAVKAALAQGKTVGAIVAMENASLLPREVIVATCGSKGKRSQAAAKLYEALRFFDKNPVDVIYMESVPEKGIGRALMNRLNKAASSYWEGHFFSQFPFVVSFFKIPVGHLGIHHAAAGNTAGIFGQHRVKLASANYLAAGRLIAQRIEDFHRNLVQLFAR